MKRYRRDFQEQTSYVGRIGKGAIRQLQRVDPSTFLVVFESGAGLYDLANRDYRWEVERSLECALYSPETSQIYLAKDELVVFDFKEETRLGDHQGERIRHVALHPSKPVLVSAGEDFTLRFWDLQKNEEVLALEGYCGPLAFRPDGKVLLACKNECVEALDVQSRVPLFRLPSPHGSGYFLKFDPAGERFCSGDEEGQLRVWDALSGDLMLEFEGQSAPVTDACFSPSGLRLACSDEAGQLRLYSTVDGEPLSAPETREEAVVAVALLDETELVFAGERAAFQWNNEGLNRLFHHRDWIVCSAFSPDGRSFATGGLDGQVWLKSGDLEDCVLQHQDAVLSLKFSEDGQYLACSGQDGGVSLYALESREVLWQAHPAANGIPHIFLYRDKLLIVDDQAVLRVLDLKEGAVEAESVLAECTVESCQWEPRTCSLAVLHDDGTLHLWALNKLFS